MYEIHVGRWTCTAGEARRRMRRQPRRRPRRCDKRDATMAQRTGRAATQASAGGRGRRGRTRGLMRLNLMMKACLIQSTVSSEKKMRPNDTPSWPHSEDVASVFCTKINCRTDAHHAHNVRHVSGMHTRPVARKDSGAECQLRTQRQGRRNAECWSQRDHAKYRMAAHTRRQPHANAGTAPRTRRATDVTTRVGSRQSNERALREEAQTWSPTIDK